jgi:23S rRNA pseudouridine1911/1915/1917 synthase
MIINENNAGQRLDICLFAARDRFFNPDISRSRIQKAIKTGLILVNGKTTSPHYLLKISDIVEFSPAFLLDEKVKRLIDPDESDPSSEITKKAELKNRELFGLIEILADEPEFLVLNKPSGLATHQSYNENEMTLVEFLVEKYPAIKKVGEDPERPGIVHRLDKDASGLLVVAKNQDMFECLKRQFKQRTVFKEYIALVYGRLESDHGSIDFPIKRSSDGYKMAALPKTLGKEKNTEGKPAHSEFLVTKRFVNYTLLNVSIMTGRTHQIRVHMSAYGHPIVGDNLYGNKKEREQNKKLNLDRIFLVSAKLSFIDLRNKKHSYEMGLPDYLTNLLKNLK